MSGWQIPRWKFEEGVTERLFEKPQAIDPVVGANRRDARLSVSLSGTNLARAGDYNLRTVLQAIRLRPDITRVDIAQQTGLTTAAIANITGKLAQAGLIKVAGRRSGGRGQPALKLTIEPDGAFGIGINVDRDHLTLVTLDLAGEVRSRVTREMRFPMPDDLLDFLRDELDAAIAKGRLDRSRIVGVGVAIPDKMGSIAMPHSPPSYAVWDQTDLPGLLRPMLPWPIHCDNDAAAAALAEAEYGTGFDNPNFFYLLVSAGLGGGLVIDRHYRRGASNRSGEIGLMPDPSGDHAGACVQDTVSVSVLLERLAAAGHPVADVPALSELRASAEPVIAGWIADSVRALAGPIIAVNCLIDPNMIMIGGRLPPTLIARLARALAERMAVVAMPRSASILPATIAKDASAVGAAILPFLDRLVPSDATLIQAGR